MIDIEESIMNHPVGAPGCCLEEYSGKVKLDPAASRPLVLACDAGYAMQLATTLRSVVEANTSGWPLNIHVLSDGFSEATQRRVFDSLPAGSASVRWVPASLGLFRDFWTREDVSKMTYARLLIPQMFSSTVSRVLYLDADILVLDDLTPLWEMDLQGAAVVGAVLDAVDPKLKAGLPGFETVPRVRNYFNAGVLLIDLERWRKERVSEKALNYMNRHCRTLYMDQDALNVACDGRWKALNPRWNFHDHFEKSIANINREQRPGIVHFVTSMKPWDARVLSLNAGFYDDFRSRTCFARNRWDKLRDGSQAIWARLRRHLRRYALLRTIWRKMEWLSRTNPRIEAMLKATSEK